MIKLTKWQKIVELIMLVVIVTTGVYKIVFSGNDTGVSVILLFVTILLFAVLTVASLFPATWRMTDSEKKEIEDPQKYQEKYTTIFILINVILSAIMVLLLLFIG